jgi:hypothetical protein
MKIRCCGVPCGRSSTGANIDVGAADPDKGNVTRAFYEAGWRGVNVEPMEAFVSRMRLRRPDDVNLSVEVGAEVGERAFYTRSHEEARGSV